MQETVDQDLYTILESSSSASYEELKANYRRLVLKYHPDKVSEDEREGCHLEFQRLDKAWKILSDSNLRHQYDTRQRATQLTNTLVNDEISLDDMSWNEDDLTYSHQCRCGGEYILSEDDASEGSRLVNCSNCSLCIEVVVEEELDESVTKDVTKR
nr:dnaJ homolog subfamily C member 24-like [Lytechinus pictus]